MGRISRQLHIKNLDVVDIAVDLLVEISVPQSFRWEFQTDTPPLFRECLNLKIISAEETERTQLPKRQNSKNQLGANNLLLQLNKY